MATINDIPPYLHATIPGAPVTLQAHKLLAHLNIPDELLLSFPATWADHLLFFGNPFAPVPHNIIYAPGSEGDQHRLMRKNGKA